MAGRAPTRRLGDEGASAVEFALVAIVLSLFLIGILQFGVTFFQWLEMEHAAREGARWASLSNSEASTKAKTIAAAPGIALTPANITVNPPNPNISMSGNPVTVTVRFDTPIFGPLMQGAFGVSGSTYELTASATQRIE